MRGRHPCRVPARLGLGYEIQILESFFIKLKTNYIKNKNIYLIEDVCESHGAKLGSKKAGALGEISNFSFYYGHHMTTIEGGMISTNSKELDRLAKMKRGHGLLRDSQDKYIIKKTIKKYKNLNNDFIFNIEGFTEPVNAPGISAS